MGWGGTGWGGGLVVGGGWVLTETGDEGREGPTLGQKRWNGVGF